MKKLVNNRPAVFIAIALSVGILSAYVFDSGYIFVAITILSVLLITSMILCCLKLFGYMRLAIALCVAVTIGFCVFQTSNTSIVATRVGQKEITLCGSVCDLSEYKDNYARLVLKNVTYNADGKEVSLPHNAQMYIAYSSYDDEKWFNRDMLSVGNVLEISGTLSDIYLYSNGVDTFNYRQDTLYNIDKITSISVTTVFKLSLDETIRQYISTTIYRYSSVESAPILKALILGDKSSMSPIDKDAFRRAGIIHVLAVSGLHIGFVVAIFAFILKKLHLNRWLRTVILIGAIVMYGYICGFPPSVMRAIIMTVVTLLYSALHRRTDLLSSLSIAVIVILCARPLFLFDAGFLMSVGAIFGIVTFTSQATRRVLFQKPRMVIDYLYKALCTSVGASLGTVGFVAHYYKEVSLIGVFFNIIAIPLVTVAFVVTAIGLLPIPAIGYIIFISDKIIWLVTTISHLLAQIPFATVVVGGFGVAIALLGIWLFVYGGFVNITHKKVTLIFLAIVFAVTTSLYALPQNASDEIVGFGSSYGGKVVVVTSKESDKAYLIGEFNDVNAIQDVYDFIVNKKINSLDICVTDFESVDTDILATYYKLLKVKTIYVMDNTVNEQCSVLAQLLDIDIIDMPNNGEITDKNINIKPIYNGSLVGALTSVGSAKLLLVTTMSPYLMHNIPKVCLQSVDVVYFSAFDAKFVEQYESSILITNEFSQNKKVYSTKEFGNFTISFKNGIINIIL